MARIYEKLFQCIHCIINLVYICAKDICSSCYRIVLNVCSCPIEIILSIYINIYNVLIHLKNQVLNNRDGPLLPRGNYPYQGPVPEFSPNPPEDQHRNLSFYKNQISSRPNGAFIETILESWKGNYKWLEKNHDFIQWLFPNRDPGTNREAAPLNDTEAKTIRETPELRNRVKRAFEMMLDFYGMRLDENDQFQLSGDHVERLGELNQWGNHNFLRISRILLALKELGHKDLMLPWMKFLAHLIYQEKTLDIAKGSFNDYWIDTLDAEDKIKLEQHLRYYTG